MSFRRGRERAGRSSRKEPLRHGWNADEKARNRALKEKRELAAEKRSHPYKDRKFDKSERRLTQEDKQLLEEMKRGRSTG